MDEGTLNHLGSLPWDLWHLWVTEERIPQKDGSLTSQCRGKNESESICSLEKEPPAWLLGVNSQGEECWGVSTWTDLDPKLPGPLSIRKMAVHGAKSTHYPRALLWESKREPWLSQAEWAPPPEPLMREADSAVSQHYWLQVRTSFQQHPVRQWEAAADNGALPFWVWKLHCLPFLLHYLYPKQFLDNSGGKRSTKRKIVDFLLIRHIHNVVCLILKRAIGKSVD